MTLSGRRTQNPTLAEKVVASALDLADEMRVMCQELVRRPSVNKKNLEQDTVTVIEQYAERFGLLSHRSEAVPGRPTLVIGPSAENTVIAGNGLLLVGHTDTVSEGDPSRWSHPPFDGEIIDNVLFGRGACDNKAGIVSAFFAMVILNTLDQLQNANPALLCVPDEESGASGTLGILHLLKSKQFGARGAIYTYPGMDQVNIGHRGLLRISITASGESVHSGSRAWQDKKRGANAVTALSELLLRLEQLNAEFDEQTSNPWTDAPRTVVTPTTIIGGSDISVVPDVCSATIDVRLANLIDGDIILQRIEELQTEIVHRRSVDRQGCVHFSIKHQQPIPPTQIDSNVPIVRSLLEAVKTVEGKDLPLKVAGPANEGYLLNQAGVPTICGFGPIGHNFHAIDESVDLTSLPTAAAIYALTAESLTRMR